MYPPVQIEAEVSRKSLLHERWFPMTRDLSIREMYRFVCYNNYIEIIGGGENDMARSTGTVSRGMGCFGSMDYGLEIDSWI